MDVAADFLIAVLQDFKAETLPSQISFVVMLAGLLLAPLGLSAWHWRRMEGRQSDMVRHAARQGLSLETARTALAEQEAELAALRRFAPDEVLARIEAERGEGNRRRAVAEADTYLGHHRIAFAVACRLLADHHLARFEDGLPALDRARTACMGAIAADPDDADLPWLLSEIEALRRVESAPKGTEAEAQAQAERDRLRRLLAGSAADTEALRAVAEGEVLAGRYRIAVTILERALDAAAAMPGGGPDSPLALNVRAELGRAMLYTGRAVAADRILSPLPGLFDRVIGSGDPATLFVKHTHAELRHRQGKPAEAEAALRELIPFCEDTLGPAHPDTLAARYLHATVLIDLGLAAEAEGRRPAGGKGGPDGTGLRGLLPLAQKVHGEAHHDTLATRYALARALLYQGKVAEAEEALVALVPLIEKAVGRDHPDTLVGRAALANALLARARPQAAEAELRELLPVQEKVLGPLHHYVQTTRLLCAWTALEQGAADLARDALAPLPADADHGMTTMLRGWLADLGGDAVQAKSLLEAAAAGFSNLAPEHPLHRMLAKYYETRVPGRPGGTMAWAPDADADADFDAGAGAGAPARRRRRKS